MKDSPTQQFLLVNVITARRYANAVHAVVVCMSVTSRYVIETTGRIALMFGIAPSTYLIVLGIRKFGYARRVLRVWNLVLNSGLRTFRRGKSIVLPTKLVDGRACRLHLRRSMRRG